MECGLECAWEWVEGALAGGAGALLRGGSHCGCREGISRSLLVGKPVPCLEWWGQAFPPCQAWQDTEGLSPMQVPHGRILWWRQHESGRCGLREHGAAASARLFHPGRAGCPGLQVSSRWRLVWCSRHSCQPWGQVVCAERYLGNNSVSHPHDR